MVICIVTPLLSLAVLYFDFPIPTELKAVIFYAQVSKLAARDSYVYYKCCFFHKVIGVIYRSTPYLTSSSSVAFDLLVNFFGFAMPFPVCLHKSLRSVVVVALLGYVPPLLALITAIVYGVWYAKQT